MAVTAKISPIYSIYKSCKLIELRFTSLFLSLTVLLSTERVLLIFLIV